jgi:hypothetical protein
MMRPARYRRSQTTRYQDSRSRKEQANGIHAFLNRVASNFLIADKPLDEVGPAHQQFSPHSRRTGMAT